MATLDLDAYRAVLEQDTVRIRGADYPMNSVSLNEAIRFLDTVEQMSKVSSGRGVTQMLGHISKVTGVPTDALDQLSGSEVVAFVRFFCGHQRTMHDGAYETATRGNRTLGAGPLPTS